MTRPHSLKTIAFALSLAPFALTPALAQNAPPAWAYHLGAAGVQPAPPRQDDGSMLRVPAATSP